MNRFILIVVFIFVPLICFCEDGEISYSEKIMYENQIKNINENLEEAVGIISTVRYISIGFLIFIVYRILISIIGMIMNLKNIKIPKWLDFLL